MTNRYGVWAFSFVTFFPPRVSVIVNPGPTVPLTIWDAGAAEAIEEAASAALATKTAIRRVADTLRRLPCCLAFIS
jgi:hypothetical protein